MTAPAQAAGIAALEDDEFVSRNRAYNKAERQALTERLSATGLEVTPSQGNFILVKFPSAPGQNADDIQAYLKSEGVIVREMGPYKLGEYLRISIGEKEANNKCAELLEAKFANG